MNPALKPCPSCGYKHPKLYKQSRRTRDLNTKEWKDSSTFSVKCPNCLMQAGPLEMNSTWPVECWNKRAE